MSTSILTPPDVESIDRTSGTAQSHGSPPQQQQQNQAADQFDSVRLTPEYRAAWDVEVWKLVMQSKLEKELKEQHKKATEQMKSSVAQRDKDASVIVEKKIREVTDELKKIQAEAAAQEVRKRKLIEAEKEVRRQSSELGEHRKRIDAEADERVRLAKIEFESRIQLEIERQKSLEQNVAAQTERVAASQKEYTKLWEEFADFKAKMLREGGAGLLGNQMETLRSQHASEIVLLTERHERKLQEVALQFEKRTQELHAENRKLSGNLVQRKEHIKTLTAELGVQRDRFRDVAKENENLKAQLQQLHHYRQQREHHVNTQRNQQQQPTIIPPEQVALQQSVERLTEALSDQHQHQCSPVAGVTSKDIKSSSAAERELQSNIERWTSEKARLLESSGGAYNEHSPVIQELSRRILKATETIQRVTSP